MNLFLHALLLGSDDSPKCMLHEQWYVFCKISTHRKLLVYGTSKNSFLTSPQVETGQFWPPLEWQISRVNPEGGDDSGADIVLTQH